MDDVGQSSGRMLSPDVENLCSPFRGKHDDCRGVAPPRRAARSSSRTGSARAGSAPAPKRTARARGHPSSSCSSPPSASSSPCCCAFDLWPWRSSCLLLIDMWRSLRIHDPISTSVNHAMVAELLHGARRERGFHGGFHGTRVAAVVTGHARLRREHRWTRKTVIRAGRALADRAEDEIGGHDTSLSSPRLSSINHYIKNKLKSEGSVFGFYWEIMCHDEIRLPCTGGAVSLAQPQGQAAGQIPAVRYGGGRNPVS